MKADKERNDSEKKRTVRLPNLERAARRQIEKKAAYAAFFDPLIFRALTRSLRFPWLAARVPSRSAPGCEQR